VDQIEQGFLDGLREKRRNEIGRGVTTIGPHRDEMRFISNGIDLGIYGSRGQVRTTMMTMKLAEVAWMKEKTGSSPVLLLDEVLAELDETRRSDLIGRVSAHKQALLTTTDVQLFDANQISGWKQWTIDGGVLNQ
jgi:DNA replication and repair protein RecF